jgi:large subunit ribosomal protein L1
MIYSKRLLRLHQIIDKSSYEFNDAINLIKKIGTSKFIESIETHISLNVGFKSQIKGNMILPHAINKTKKIAVFSDDLNSEIDNTAVTIINLEKLLYKINSNCLDFDILIANQKDLGKLSSVSRILGSKGLMPSLKNGTITQNFSQTILKFSDDKINYKVDKYGIIHLIFGKINFTEKKLNDNLSYIINHLNNSKPNNIKGKFIKNVHICTTMSPSIKISNY